MFICFVVGREDATIARYTLSSFFVSCFILVDSWPRQTQDIALRNVSVSHAHLKNVYMVQIFDRTLWLPLHTFFPSTVAWTCTSLRYPSGCLSFNASCSEVLYLSLPFSMWCFLVHCLGFCLSWKSHLMPQAVAVRWQVSEYSASVLQESPLSTLFSPSSPCT